MRNDSEAGGDELPLVNSSVDDESINSKTSTTLEQRSEVIHKVVHESMPQAPRN
jgi:hypothetical protein